MKTYIALFEYDDSDGFSVVFPDLPGLVTAGDTYEEACQMAHEGLASHIHFLEGEGEPVPQPRTVEEIKQTWEDWKEWQENYQFMVVPVSFLPLTAKPKRINIVIDENLLDRLDLVTKNRSAYISKALEMSLYK